MSGPSPATGSSPIRITDVPDGSSNTAVSANFTYDDHRDLVSVVENKREVTTAETISRVKA